jgi:hypothetical protein
VIRYIGRQAELLLHWLHPERQEKHQNWCGGTKVIALRLVRLIENHSDELAEDLIRKLQRSVRTRDMRKVPVEELRGGMHEILHHLSEWLLSKTETDIEQRYLELGARRAGQGVSLADLSWAIVLTKEYIWDFLQQQGFLRGPVELYGEMELLRLLDQFFDRALCYATEGYEHRLCAAKAVAAPA